MICVLHYFMKDSFKQVFDSRGQRVRGLWSRNGLYYAQLRVGDGRSPMRMQLHGAATVPQAVESMQALKKQRRDGLLSVDRRTHSPSFTVFANTYLSSVKELGLKRPLTISRESSCIASLARFFGDKPVSRINEADAHDYAAKRMAGGVSGRAVDVDIVVLRNIFKKAKRDGYVRVCPIGEWVALDKGPRNIRLVSRQEIDALKQAACQTERGPLFSDYLELLACSGGREQETLRLRWSANVDWERRLLGFGQDRLSKFGKMRWVPMNQPLEEHLKAMRIRAGASDYLFPSRFSDDQPVHTYRKVLDRAMEIAGVKEFGFHHLRHYFTSHAIMSGVDMRTTADWLGHADGGVLVCKKYSHLSNEHSQRQADKVSL